MEFPLKNSCVMYESIKKGKQLELSSEPTLSDGTAGGVEIGSITFDMCNQIIDDFSTVNEDEIANGVKIGIGKHHQLIEGAKMGTAIAGFIKKKETFKGQTVILVMCGGNISGAVLEVNIIMEVVSLDRIKSVLPKLDLIEEIEVDL